MKQKDIGQMWRHPPVRAEVPAETQQALPPELWGIIAEYVQPHEAVMLRALSMLRSSLETAAAYYSFSDLSLQAATDKNQPLYRWALAYWPLGGDLFDPSERIKVICRNRWTLSKRDRRWAKAQKGPYMYCGYMLHGLAESGAYRTLRRSQRLANLSDYEVLYCGTGKVNIKAIRAGCSVRARGFPIEDLSGCNLLAKQQWAARRWGVKTKQTNCDSFRALKRWHTLAPAGTRLPKMPHGIKWLLRLGVLIAPSILLARLKDFAALIEKHEALAAELFACYFRLRRELKSLRESAGLLGAPVSIPRAPWVDEGDLTSEEASRVILFVQHIGGFSTKYEAYCYLGEEGLVRQSQVLMQMAALVGESPETVLARVFPCEADDDLDLIPVVIEWDAQTLPMLKALLGPAAAKYAAQGVTQILLEQRPTKMYEMYGVGEALVLLLAPEQKTKVYDLCCRHARSEAHRKYLQQLCGE